MYTCPMHPEIASETLGRCSKCGMNLVLKKDARIKAQKNEEQGLGMLAWKSYMPLAVIIGVILLATLALSLRDSQVGMFNAKSAISYFMIGFFLTFAAFKLMDVKGFAEGYSAYDLLAMRMPSYGYIYPFIELFFGLAMILLPFSPGLLWSELVVMSFSGFGVAIKIAKKEEFMCACLGTFLKVPLTKVTLIEDFGMAALASIMLLI
jgi:hypothetical protein